MKKPQLLQSLPALGPLPVQTPCLLTLPFSHSALVGSSPRPLAEHPRLCASSAPALLFYIAWSHSSDTAVPWAPLCPSFQQAVPPHTRLTGEGLQGQTPLGAGGAPPHSLSTSRSKSLWTAPAWFSARQE